jgi:hypothetical protein
MRPAGPVGPFPPTFVVVHQYKEWAARTYAKALRKFLAWGVRMGRPLGGISGVNCNTFVISVTPFRS